MATDTDVLARAAPQRQVMGSAPTGSRMHALYVVPTLIFNFAIILIPALLTIALAFCSWDGISAPQFVGLANFQTMFSDPVFWTALTNNIIWTVIFLTIPILMGLVAATTLLSIAAYLSEWMRHMNDAMGKP